MHVEVSNAVQDEGFRHCFSYGADASLACAVGRLSVLGIFFSSFTVWFMLSSFSFPAR